MELEARCRTTAMGIMPHTDVERALKLALGLDIPFWPQLPKVSFYEDMYVQASQNFPGIVVDHEGKRISFDTAKFEEELGGYSQKMDKAETFALNQDFSAVYHRFLAKDLKGYYAIRGQVTGPVSFGFKVVDEKAKPIIYNDGIRAILFDFIQRKANIQHRELSQKNRNAFVWVDEPGLGWVFSGLSGYNDVQAKEDYQDFLNGLEGPKGLHLCANVNLPYLLELGIEILSFDAYQMETMPKGYTSAVAEFLRAGGVICWGIVPTDSTSLGKETPGTLARQLTSYWQAVSQNTGLAPRQIAERALVAPARCCLKNTGQVGAVDEIACQVAEKDRVSSIEEGLVEKAFALLPELSQVLRDKYGL
ncbi:MAG: hypothetical protein IBX36_04795 [Dehalococcoidia bacterium]|nr:hypothetical protein [Dehalococcoidia bacterium]